MPKQKQSTTSRHSFLYRNSLTLAFLALMAASLVGHALTGQAHHNQERQDHGQPPLSVAEYESGLKNAFIRSDCVDAPTRFGPTSRTRIDAALA